MTRETRRRKWRWLRHLAWVLGAKIFLIIAGLTIFFGSGAGNPLLRRLVLHRLEAMTGGRAELRTFSVRWMSLRVTLQGLVIHGREPAGTEALFSAEQVQAGLRVDSLWGPTISLNDVLVQQPHVHIRVERDGSTNVPAPQRKSSSYKSARETLFDVHLRRLRLEDGWILYNDVKTPLAVEGGDLRLALDAGGSLSHPLYLGTLEWQSIRFTAQSFLPLPVNLSAKFTLWREGFTLEQGLLTAGRSHFDAQAEMAGFSEPKWSFRYRGWLNLLDLREVLRTPEVPAGLVDLRGEGAFSGGEFRGTGSYTGQGITLRYTDFHVAGLTSRASYRMDNNGMVLPDFFAQAFDGTVSGSVVMRFPGLLFRAATHVQNVRLAKVLPALEHSGFPVDELHWDAVLSADTVETWTAALKHFEISGKTHWEEPATIAEQHIPVSADWQFRYRHDPRALSIDTGEFETPSTRGSFAGVFARNDSALDVHLETGALETYKDFIHAIQGIAPDSPEAAKSLTGSARWDGKILGPAEGPAFQGQVRGERIRYGGLAFDFLDGDLSYSPSELTLARGHVHHGAMEMEIAATLALTGWSFLPENTWSADINLEKTPVESLEQLFGWSYPVRGLLTGQFHGRGTREEPVLIGLFDLAEGRAYGVSFNGLRGLLNVTPGEVRVANAELRVFPPGKENIRGAGIVTGSIGYRYAEHTISADLVGASLPLEHFEKLQMPRLPVGGLVTFHLKASGPAAAPLGEGTFRVVDFRVGEEVIGSFDGNLLSDGHTARFELSSAMSTGAISGGLTMGLADPFPANGKISIKNINLNPLLVTALHLWQWNGRATADGDIAVSGSLQHPESIVADANFSHFLVNYANVQLENDGPIRFRFSRDDLEIEPVSFRGPDTNLKIDGAVHFSGSRAVGLHLNGVMNLRLLSGLFPALDARGPAQINAAFEGTLDHPRITGRVRLENASLRAADFPTGLSGVTGDFVFGATRLFFENVRAEAGGGVLNFSGSVNYSEHPLRYEVAAHTDRVRIRYPEGMSWLAAGSLRLSGTLDSAVLSGHVTVERVTLTQGLDAAGLLVSAKEGVSGAETSSSFLRNLQFDIEALSTPDARMEWPGAALEAEANLRVRGTWEHPILLGHIHILSGDLYFHENRYMVTRGDLNFANPFRLDPLVNVEATTTIQQYEITLNFTGLSSKLQLAYRSDPPLPANDIVTLLALGKTSAEASIRSGGTTQGTAAGASALLSEAISSQLGGRLERLFGITRLRVDPGLTGFGASGAEQNAAARVTVEQRIARNLTITYVSNVSSTQQQLIQVEYNVNRNISIVALRDRNGTFGIDVKIKKRFP